MKRILIILLFPVSLTFFSSCSGGGGGTPVSPAYDYHMPEEVEAFLDEVRLNYPDIVSLESVGYSTDNRPIRAIVISDNPGVHEGEPAVRLTGGIHGGGEKVTVELMIRIIEYLTYNYGKSSDVTDLVNSRYIVIIPVLNPDGLAAGKRYNSNGVDLNRNFSVAWSAGTVNGENAFSEAESRAIRDFSLSQVFHLSITYHSGAEVVNMPFDYTLTLPAEKELVKVFGKTYTTSGTFLDNPDLLQDSDMDEGTIYGSYWFKIPGSMQDWSYLETGCLDFTVEVYDDFNPTTETGVQQVFMYNRDSIMAYIAKAGYGAHGRVTDSSGNPVTGVEISAVYDAGGITGDIVTETDSQGYYHRVLLPGSYTLTFSKNGFTDKVLAGVTVPDNSAGVLQNVVMN